MLPIDRSGYKDWYGFADARTPVRTDDRARSEDLIDLSPVSVVFVTNDAERQRAEALRPMRIKAELVDRPSRPAVDAEVDR